MQSDKAYLYFKLSLVGAIISLTMTFFLVMTLFQHGQDLTVIPQFYTQPVGRSNQQIEVIPFKADDSIESHRLNWNLIDEMLVRYYVETRFSSLPDPLEMARRWAPGSLFYMLSSPSLYKPYQNLKEKVGKLPAGVKTVDILRVDRSPYDKNVYDVDFDIYTLNENTGLSDPEKKNVQMHIVHNLKRRFYKSTFANPYGAYFDRFNLTDRK